MTRQNNPVKMLFGVPLVYGDCVFQVGQRDLQLTDLIILARQVTTTHIHTPLLLIPSSERSGLYIAR